MLYAGIKKPSQIVRHESHLITIRRHWHLKT